MNDSPRFPDDILWDERQLALAPMLELVVTTRTYPLEQANQALADMPAGRFEGAAVLVA